MSRLTPRPGLTRLQAYARTHQGERLVARVAWSLFGLPLVGLGMLIGALVERAAPLPLWMALGLFAAAVVYGAAVFFPLVFAIRRFVRAATPVKLEDQSTGMLLAFSSVFLFPSSLGLGLLWGAALHGPRGLPEGIAVVASAVLYVLLTWPTHRHRRWLQGLVAPARPGTVVATCPRCARPLGTADQKPSSPCPGCGASFRVPLFAALLEGGLPGLGTLYLGDRRGGWMLAASVPLVATFFGLLPKVDSQWWTLLALAWWAVPLAGVAGRLYRRASCPVRPAPDGHLRRWVGGVFLVFVLGILALLLTMPSSGACGCTF